MAKQAEPDPALTTSGLVAGLVSVTFRDLSAAEVVDLATNAGLSAIEWGGDVHVPQGDVDTATKVGALCRESGLDVVSYGSYFRAGDTDQGEFSDVVRTAQALGAPSIRVWAGTVGSAPATEEQRESVASSLASAVDEAEAAGLRVALEFHPNTLTDTVRSTLNLLEQVDRDTLGTYWQPGRGTPPLLAAEQVRALLPRLSVIHAFSWAKDGTREPLAEQEEMWTGVLNVAAADDREHPVLLEFVAEDDPKTFAADAKTLLGWLQALPGGKPAEPAD